MEGGRIVGYVPPPGSTERTKLLRLKVIAGHNLAKKDIFGASDPYLRIDLVTVEGDDVEDSVLTKTKKRTLNPKWEEEFIFRVKPSEHKLVLEVFDENRLTRDDFLGMVELPLQNMPREMDGRTVPHKYYILRPRSARSKVKGHLQLYHAYVSEPGDVDEQSTAVEDLEPAEDNAQESGWEMVAPSPSVASSSAAAAASAGAASAAEELPANVRMGGGGGGGARQTNHSMSDPGGGAAGASSLAAATAANDAAAQDSSIAAPSLPPGWEERTDANGRTYYVNHVARTTQWQHPAVTEEERRSRAGEDERRARHQTRTHISNDDSFDSAHRDRESVTSSVIETLHNLSIESPPSPASAAAAANGAAAAAASGPRSSFGVRSHLSGSLDVPDSRASPSYRGGEHAPPPAASSPSGAAAAAEGAAAEGLPSGWTMQVAPNGRVFYINHVDKKTTWVDPRTGRPTSVPSQADVPNRRPNEDHLAPLPEGWEERVHTDGRIFFIDHNTRATQWEDPRISNPSIAGPAIPYNRDSKRKLEYLKQQLKKPSNVPNKLEIKVRRNNIFQDSFRQIQQFPANKVDILKTKLWIEFDGEVGLDYGGVAREWFNLLSKEMFNPYYGLFEYSATDNYTLQINPNSGVCNEEHLSYFKFIGRVAGMAVYHGKLLDGFFIRPFYKMMLGKSIELKDMESVDAEYYNSLVYIKDNDPTDLVLNFEVDEDNFGTAVPRELKPGGSQIPVTEKSKEEYIQLVIEWRFISRVKKQMDKFLEGFNELVPLALIKIFDEGELELLLCGVGSIDVKDWKQNTVYKGDYHPNHIVVQWFWRVVLSSNNEMRSRLLQFVTGTSRVPMNGFKELYGSNGPQLFTIEKWGNPSSYPRAHTCFNRLDLPPYESYQSLRDRLINAIEGSEGFAGVD